jgi:hypothetical protein
VSILLEAFKAGAKYAESKPTHNLPLPTLEEAYSSFLSSHPDNPEYILLATLHRYAQWHRDNNQKPCSPYLQTIFTLLDDLHLDYEVLNLCPSISRE